MAGKTKVDVRARLEAEAEAEKEAEEEGKEEVEEKKEDGVMRIFFDPPHYTVMESVGSFEVTIVRYDFT